MKNLVTRIQNRVNRILDKFLLHLYKYNQRNLVREVRKKEKIKVLFVVFELGSWKTERLYRAMKKHSRFSPLVVVTPSIENYLATNVLVEYLKRNDIDFIIANGEVLNLNQLNGDIIFYQKPYDGCYPYQYLYKYNLNYLFCYVLYAHHTLYENENQPLYDAVWLRFFENKSAIEELLPLIHNKKNLVSTGFPSIDDLISAPKIDPWKRQQKRKKRIIYAPHHSIGYLHAKGIAYSTFLELGELILNLAIKYKDETQWVFKPHPRLYDKLLTIWGKEKTDSYYRSWEELDNAQIEEGVYADLFKTSDAMIHDCSSFTIEYLTTKKPVMYLTHCENDHHQDNMLPYARRAFELHYKGFTKQLIEEFVNNVINGVDPLKSEREKYFEECLLPPHGKTACENIINAILGEAEYSNV